MSNDYLGDDLKNKEAQRASLFLSLTVRLCLNEASDGSELKVYTYCYCNEAL